MKEAIEEKQWVLCTICGAKTRLQLLPETELKSFPLFCPKCRRESIINANHFKVLCAERQILCRTVEGVGSFGAIMELDILEKYAAVIYMVLAAAPQPLIGSEQIQG